MIQKQLLDDVHSTLTRGIIKSLGQNPLEIAVTAWLAPDVSPKFEWRGLLDDIVSTAKRTYRQTAVLGVAAQVERLNNTAISSLTTDLEQLFGREPVVSGTPMPFCMDGLALSGIMLGAHFLGDDSLTARAATWIARCCEVTADGKGLEEWQEWLLRLVGSQTSLPWIGNRSWSPTASTVSVALRSKGVVPVTSAEAEETEEEEALAMIQASSGGELPLGYAVLRLAALNWIRRIRPVADLRAASTEDLVCVLRRLSDGLKCWTWEDRPRTRTSPEARRWHVDNEYHVQNILWLLLAPIFPDLVPEDYTPKVGPGLLLTTPFDGIY